ncbi:hypothetical protein HYW59_00240 [Candidatus Kaiserbacteria bacterium]|nr:hypothetical protein [Candidatus Kaiserbacteria bacterium]
MRNVLQKLLGIMKNAAEQVVAAQSIDFEDSYITKEDAHSALDLLGKLARKIGLEAEFAPHLQKARAEVNEPYVCEFVFPKEGDGVEQNNHVEAAS